MFTTSYSNMDNTFEGFPHLGIGGVPSQAENLLTPAPLTPVEQ